MLEYPWDNGAFVITRLGLWAALLLAVLVDWLLHRRVKIQGYPLHRWIVLVLCLIVLKETLWTLHWSQQSGLLDEPSGENKTSATPLPLLDDGASTSSAWSASPSASSPLSSSGGGLLSSGSVYLALVFFVDLTDTLFILLLLLIAVGYKITRDALPKSAWKSIIGIPVLYFLSLLIADYIVIIDTGAVIVTNKIGTLSSTTLRQVLLAVTAVNIFCMVYLWIWIFQSIRGEIRGLLILVEGRAPPLNFVDILVGTAPALAPSTTEPASQPPAASLSESPPPYSALVHTPDAATSDQPPQHAAAEAPQYETHVQQPPSPGPHPGTTASSQPSEPQESAPQEPQPEAPDDYSQDYELTPVADTKKLQLLKRVNVMVSLYLLVTVCLFVWTAYQEAASGPLVVIRSLLSLVFMSGLCFTFRLRHENPYFLVSNAEDAASENEFAMSDMSAGRSEGDGAHEHPSGVGRNGFARL